MPFSPLLYMVEILHNKKFKIVKLGGAMEIVTITPLHFVDETSPERLIDLPEASCRARSQNLSLGFFYGLTSGTSNRSGFLGPLSPIFPKFFKLPGGSGSLLLRERLLDRPLAKKQLEPELEALGTFQTQQRLGEEVSFLACAALSLTPRARVPREPDLGL